MSYFTRYRQYESEGQVFHVPHGIRTTRSAKIYKKYVSINKSSNFELPPGMFIARAKDANGDVVFRPLPQATVTTASTTSSTRFKVKMPYMFVAGDVLKVIEPYGTLTVASTALGTLTTAGGQVYSYTPTGASTAAEAATKWVDYLNNTALANEYRFVANGAIITAFENNLNRTSTLTPTGGLGTTALTTALDTTTVGTVASIDPDTEEVVLAANAAVAVPVGYVVGVQVDDIYGIYSKAIVFNDFRDNMEIAVADECKLKLSVLPFWANYIRNYLPRVEARDKY